MAQQRIVKMYLIWGIISLLLLLAVKLMGLERYLLLAVIFLLLVDLFIDLDVFRVMNEKIHGRMRFRRHGEHAPFVFFIVLFGMLGILAISYWTILVAGVDLLIDIGNDFGVI